MPIWTYVAGTMWTGVVALSIGRSAFTLVARLIPAADRAVTRLAASVVGLTILLSLGQLLGSVGALTWWAVPIASVTVLTVTELVVRPAEPSAPPSITPDEADDDTDRRRVPFFLASGCVAAVAWQWTTHLADAYGRGMMQPDNLWYHGPFAARFLQTRSLGDLGTLGYPEARAYPLNSELLNALMTLPFGRDVLVPLTAHLFAALAIGAAYVIGRRWNAGALAILSTTVALSLPLIARTQPGQMYNDVVVTALILATVALLVTVSAGVGGISITAAALGVGIATKLSSAGVAGTLALGVLAVLIVTHRYRSAIAWTVVATVTGGFWFGRNVVLYDSPVPYLDVALGPLRLERSIEPIDGPSLIGSLDQWSEVRSYYLDSIQAGFGPLWFVVVALSIGGCAAIIARARDWRLLAAVAAAVGLVTYPFLPVTGLLAFANNLRYVFVALTLGLVMAALAAARSSTAQVAMAVAFAACVVSNLVVDQPGRVPAWPGYHVWGAVSALSCVAIAWSATVSGRSTLGRLRSLEPTVLVTAGAVLVGAMAVGGWFVHDHYMENRYADGSHPEYALQRPFLEVSDATVDVIGTVESYPMFGSDLSNTVISHNDEVGLDAPAPAQPCRYWRRTLHQGDAYLAVMDGWVFRSFRPDDRQHWFAGDASTDTLVDEGTFNVYFHTEPLDPSTC